MAEVKQTEEVHPAKNKTVIVLFRGCLKPPKDIGVCRRKGNDNEEKEDYLNDIKLVTEYVQFNKKYYYLHKIYNIDKSNDMKCDDILKEIENASKFTKNNNGMMLRIYYTGFGQINTGNWCFIDGVISFQDIINVITKYYQKTCFSLMSDCSFSGNWALELFKYKSDLDLIYIPCASYPFKEAYSHKNGKGGLFTLWWTEELDRNKTRKLRDCKAKIEDGKYSIDYFAPKTDDAKFH